MSTEHGHLSAHCPGYPPSYAQAIHRIRTPASSAAGNSTATQLLRMAISQLRSVALDADGSDKDAALIINFADKSWSVESGMERGINP